MKKYFLLILVSGLLTVGCQQVEESNSAINQQTVDKIEKPQSENAYSAEKKVVPPPVAVDTEVKKEVEKKVEKKVVAKPVKPKKVVKKQTQPKKKLSADLVKNTKTAAPKSNKPKGPLPKLEFEYKSFDFGTVDEGDTIIHKFNFKNTGTAPAIITEASSSCGCTVPSYPKKPIKPGASGVIEVMFNTKGKLLEQKKSITLTANTEPKYNTLYLEGLVYRRPAKKEDKKEEKEKEEKTAKKKTKDNKTTKTNKPTKEELLNEILKKSKEKDLDKPKKEKL